MLISAGFCFNLCSVFVLHFQQNVARNLSIPSVPGPEEEIGAIQLMQLQVTVKFVWKEWK